MEQEVRTTFCVGQLSDGRFVAASNTPPYFCFRADTEEQAIERAFKALEFYFNAADSWIAAPVAKQATLNTWSKTRTVQMPPLPLAACA
jgi:predicted RNase H-like HicB family nuclease